MDTPDENPIQPAVPGLSWRSLHPNDLVTIISLAASCLEADGGLSLCAMDTYVQQHYLAAGPGVSIGAFQTGGPLFACAAVQATHTQEECRAIIVGQVHPIYRRRGIGTFLLRWSIAEAKRLLAACPQDRRLQITTEMLTEAAERLFERHGFMRQFAEDVMRFELNAWVPHVLLPAGIRFAMWTPTLASQFFEIYQAAFRQRPGYPDWSQEKWTAWLATDDDDFRPELSLLALHGGLPVGFIVCGDEWIIQMGVRPAWRGKGIGSALVTEVLRRFKASGFDHVLLNVNVNNTRAARVYAGVGFKRIGRRGRYGRPPINRPKGMPVIPSASQ